ncbi:catalase, partial [Bacillus pseudomycoides]|uniref:catalase n=1 Tax=Bacillus pseudomycoides TaxID=64104 RepID=UPI00284AAAB2
DMVNCLKPATDTNIQTTDRYWDFMTLSPESTNMMTWVFSDYGTPEKYRQMEGYGVQSLKWISAESKIVYKKYHWKTQQGV